MAGFLAAEVFVFWALRDSVLAPNGCSLPFLNFILFFPWCKLCKKETADLGVVDAGLEIPEDAGRGERQQSPSPRPLHARPGRREGHFVALAGGPRAGGAGAGAKGRSL